MSRRVLITGGAGVIGQRLVERHVAAGDEVRVIDRLPAPTDMSADVDYVQGDLVTIGRAAIRDHDPHVLYHLAAAFERSDEHPEFWLENAHDNVAASAAVLQGAIEADSLRRYVFASSYLIYDPDLYLADEPTPEPRSIAEDSPIDPRNACGAAKLLHEKEIELAEHVEHASFTSVSARIYRVYGRSSRDVVSRWVRAAIAGETLTVYGEESWFDYVFADDVAEGLHRLADSEATGVVNLASGTSRTVRELVACIKAHFPEVEVDGPHPAATYESSQASLERLRDVTGWTPTSSLEYGVSQLVAHEIDNARNGTVSPRVLPPRNVNVLISSLSRKAPLVAAVRDGLGALSATGTVWGADSSPTAPARRVVDSFWHTPPLDDLSDDDIVSFCVENEIGLLIPTRDGELLRFAALKPALSAVGTHVPIGDPTSVRSTLDKLVFARRLEDAGVNTIPTSDDVDALTAERFVVKPRSGAGASGLRLDLDHDEASDAMRVDDGLVAQPWIAGPEYSVDAYVRSDGSIAGSLARRRERVEYGEAVVTTTVDDPRVTELAERCLEELATRGHAVVQVIDDPITGPIVVECNSRIGGASAAAFAAGLRTVDAMLSESLGDEVPDLRPRAGVTLTRLASDDVTWR